MSADIITLIPMDQSPNRIRELRMAEGMSQEELAGRARCSKMQISGLERGKPELTVHWMRRIADALGVHPAELLRKDDNPHGAATEEERRMLAAFREAPHAFQHQLIAMSEAVATLTDTPAQTAAQTAAQTPAKQAEKKRA